jgi:LysM repeat protein
MDAAHSLDQLAAIPDLQAAATAGAKAIGDVPRLEAARDRLTSQLTAARGRPTHHTVAPGDHLSKIADRYGLIWQDLQEWNQLTSTTLRPGQVLRLYAPTAAPAPELEPPAAVARTVYSWDISDLGNDKARPDAAKIASHKALFGVDNIQNVRQFSGTGVPSWSNERFAALTERDSVLVSTLSRDRAGLLAWLKATPEKFRQRPGQVKLCHGHEREANLTVGPVLQEWLDGCREKADLLVAAGIPTMSEDDFVKITLHHSQHHETNPATPNREQVYGGQDFGIFGEDAYSYRTWINQQNRYETPVELLGEYVSFLYDIGLPGALPEWGAERTPKDTTGAGRAKFIADTGAYVRSLRMADGTPLIRFVNWWCADGFRDGARVLHHLEEHGPTSPEVAAYKALMHA